MSQSKKVSLFLIPSVFVVGLLSASVSLANSPRDSHKVGRDNGVTTANGYHHAQRYHENMEAHQEHRQEMMEKKQEHRKEMMEKKQEHRKEMMEKRQERRQEMMEKKQEHRKEMMEKKKEMHDNAASPEAMTH